MTGALALLNRRPISTEALFLGPKGENAAVLRKLIDEAIDKHVQFRQNFHPEDPLFITGAVRASAPYRQTMKTLQDAMSALCDRLQGSAPIFSMRHQGHMLWDQSLPAIAGYIAAMFYNQNNVAAEASPVTTQLEIAVGNDFCKLLGYSVAPETPSTGPAPIAGWGHITCDGSVANMEALWSARNAKFFAAGLRSAILKETALEKARALNVNLLDGTSARLIDLDDWTLVNLRLDDVVRLPQDIEGQFGICVADTTAALAHHAVQNIGMCDFYARVIKNIAPPVAIAPSTRHYSWPKAATLIGIGQNAIRSVEVDLDARMQISSLRTQLERCLEERIPVISVVAVIGSTEESAVDPLADILDVRDEFRKQGLDFTIHADAAWGGYFNALLRNDEVAAPFFRLPYIPEIAMNAYVNKQYEVLSRVDSITIDPHKAGYVPYPAGGLCYRNSAQRDMVSLKAPVIYHSQTEPTVGVYGIEGSKPGAAAAAVFLTHRVIPPTKGGFGRILGQCLWTSKRLYCRLVSLTDARFKIVVFQRLPAERAGKLPAEIEAERDYIRENFVGTSNDDLMKLLQSDPQAKDCFMQLGSDQVILAYSFIELINGKPNTDWKRFSQLNNAVFKICSITDQMTNAQVNLKNLIVTSSSFDAGSYGQSFINDYAKRLGLPENGGTSLPFLISTTMNPWVTDTPSGDFLEVIQHALRDAVHQALDDPGTYKE